MSGIVLSARAESWPLARPFTISRGTKTHADVVVVEARLGGHTGRGESTPYARYGETVSGVLDEIARLGTVHDRGGLQERLPPGAARNAVDCAVWDLEAKLAGRRAGVIAGVEPPATAIVTAYTLSLDTADAMAREATARAELPLLKLKLGGAGDADRMRAVRAARPDARLIADANEAWSREQVGPLLEVAREAGFETIEQPLPAGEDEMLAQIARAVPVCADESVHTAGDVERLVGRYDGLNIKLDKTGGLTEALVLLRKAHALRFKVMIGSMVATSLAMAPAYLLTAGADWVDLDSPLLLKCDREHGLVIEHGRIAPPTSALWG